MSNKNVESDSIHQLLNMKYTRWERLLFPFRRGWNRLCDKSREAKLGRQRAKKCYSEDDMWNVSYWFVKVMQPMLSELSEKTYHHPDSIEFQEWVAMIKRMSDLLSLMDPWDEGLIRERLSLEEDDRTEMAENLIIEEQRRAKDEFFTLFNKWFYHL